MVMSGLRFRVGHVELDVAADDVVHDDFFASEPKADRASVFVNPIRGAELVEIALVNRLALALEIRAEVAAHFRTFIPIKFEPAQSVVNCLRGFGRVPRPVSVLDPQNQRAAGVFRVEPVEERRPRAADVEITGGRWGKANTDGRRHGPNSSRRSARMKQDW